MTFKELYVQGEASLGEIDDHVDKWHSGGTGLSLPDFLGLSESEYDLFVENSSMFEVVMSFRHGESRRA